MYKYIVKEAFKDFTYIFGFMFCVVMVIWCFSWKTSIDATTELEQLNTEKETARAKYIEHIIENINVVKWNRTSNDEFATFVSGLIKIEVSFYTVLYSVSVYYDDEICQLKSDEENRILTALEKRYGNLK